MNKIALVFLLVIGAISFKGQTKYWIKLKNKTGTPYVTSNPSAFLTNKAIQRRITYGISIDQTDLPVTPSYVSQIDAVSGVTVLYASKWMNAVAVSVTNTTALTTINSFSFVLNTAPVNKYKLVFEKVNETQEAAGNQRISALPNYYGGSYWQNKQLNVDCIHSQGYRGQNMTIAVLDAGFYKVDVLAAFDSLRTRGGILGTRDFVTGGNSVYEDDTHGMEVLSCIAGLIPNYLVGSAPRANFWLLRTEDAATETPSEEYNWIRGAEFADSCGADILTTSLGYTTFDNGSYDHTFAMLDGKTVPMSIAATMAARKGMFVLNAAGNGNGSSWSKISFPADADSICTVGAIDSLSNVTSFSSIGPTADGRIKPDLSARGGNAFVAIPSGGGMYGNGTSFATPVLAGAVACFWQAHPSYNNIKVLDTLKHTASNASNPNNSIGWGRPNVCALPISVKENTKTELQVNIFPNPVKDRLMITLSNEAEFPVSITVTDVIGKTQLIKLLQNSNDKELDLSGLKSGLYFLKLNGKSGSALQKIIKD